MSRDATINDLVRNIQDLMSQSRISFLMGAGCSICAGLPAMKMLTQQVEDILKRKFEENDSEGVYKLYCELSLGFSHTESNIEDYLSDLQDLGALAQRKVNKGLTDHKQKLTDIGYSLKQINFLINEIKNSIRDILSRDITTMEHHRKFCKAIHRDLVYGRDHNKQTVNYFLLNYDTLIEDALALEHVYFVDGFIGGSTAWWDIESYENSTKKTGSIIQAKVFKLHGSIDWVKLNDRPLPIRIRSTIKNVIVPGSVESVLIYPSTVKYMEAECDPFAQTLNKFRNTLSHTENHILFIMGYGFNDEHINAEILNGLRNSNGALSIVVFSGDEKLAPGLVKLIKNPEVANQVIIFGKTVVLKHGVPFLTAENDETFNWFKFDVLAKIACGEVINIVS